MQYGFYYHEVTYPPRGVFALPTTLPITYPGYYSPFMCVRNNSQFASGIEQRNQSLIILTAQSHSDIAQSVYGAYWFTIGS